MKCKHNSPLKKLYCSYYELVDPGSTVSQMDQLLQNWAPHWSYLFSAVQIHTTTHSRFYREQLNPHLLRRSCLYMLVYEIPGSDWIFNKWRCVNMKTNRDFLSGSKRDETNVAWAMDIHLLCMRMPINIVLRYVYKGTYNVLVNLLDFFCICNILAGNYHILMRTY